MGWFRGDESAANQQAYGGKMPATPLTPRAQRQAQVAEQADAAVEGSTGGNGILNGF